MNRQSSVIIYIDYIIEEPDCNIFIDAKATEASYITKVSDNPVVIANRCKDSAIKAIQQAYSYNNFLLHSDSGPVAFKRSNYLLVVTYKELYLGNGKVFYDTIAKGAIDKIRDSIAKKAAHMPLENIYFMNVGAFDYLCAVVKNNTFSFEQILKHAIQNDTHSDTRKFEFMQHLTSLKVDLTRPSYLNQALDDLRAFIQVKKRIG
jgi:hypothetical protein